MISGGTPPIEYKINYFPDIDFEKDYIVIIGASNSMMNNGWAYHFSEIFGKNRVVNLSLGATCSSYIAFVFLMYRDILEGAKYIIIEPFVNDVSFFGNKEISTEVLATCMSYYYFSGFGDKIIVLLLPTKKRIYNIDLNVVYNAHIRMASKSNVKILDCHPFFSNLTEEGVDQAFTDPAHLNSDYSFAIANWVASYISKNLLIKSLSDIKYNSPSELFYFGLNDLEPSVFKSSSLFSCKLMDLAGQIFVDIPHDFNLLGILHWSDYDENLFKIKSCGYVQQGFLRSKYLKLTSLSFNICGPFSIINESDHSFGVGGFLLSKNTINDFIYDKKSDYENNMISNRIHKVLLE